MRLKIVGALVGLSLFGFVIYQDATTPKADLSDHVGQIVQTMMAQCDAGKPAYAGQCDHYKESPGAWRYDVEFEHELQADLAESLQNR